MRVIYFSLDYTPHDHRFLAALAETSHEVHYVRLQCGSRQVEDRPVPEKIRQVLWAGGRQPFRWRDLPKLAMDFRRLTREIRPDIIHAGPIQTCAFIAALTGFHPLLTMSWGFDLMEDVHRNWRYEKITRYVLRRTDFFTSDAQVTRDQAVAYGMRPDRTIVFPWGVDLQHFSPLSTLHGRSSEGFTLFCNRSWEPRYGVDVLARAFVRVAQRRPEVGLILLGGGSQAAILRRIFEQGGVSERVTFAGQIPNRDLPRYYRMADLYISPSHVDGSSVSLMEALACGLPCLVSDIPANREWVQDGVNGWLFPDGNDALLAEKILQVMDDKERMAIIGRAARQTAEQKANWNQNFNRLLEAYELAMKTLQKEQK